MLKSKIFHNGEIYDSETGTPQGGVLSPLLANVALTSFDRFCSQFSWQYKAGGKTHTVNPIVRYADDWTVICQTETQAQRIKAEIAKHLYKEIGLKLSDEKTHITHITKGFNFLGFHFRKYNRHQGDRKKSKKALRKKNRKNDSVLLIRPQREKILNCKRKIKSVLKKNKTTKQSSVIHQLNSILRGWGNYYRHVVSSQVFRAIDYDAFWKCFRWARRRHPNKSKSWVIKRYFHRKGRWKLSFIDWHDKRKPSLVKLSEVKIHRHLKVGWKYRVYDGNPQTIEYWQRREYFKGRNGLTLGSVQEKLFVGQKGLCAWCNTPLEIEETGRESYQTHHLLPQQFGGTHQLRNLRLVHTECHRTIHRLFSTEQMARYAESKIDYLRLFKGKRTVEEGESVAR